jgi:hypothetical protein
MVKRYIWSAAYECPPTREQPKKEVSSERPEVHRLHRRRLTLSRNPWAVKDIQNINEPKIVCMGMIHDRLRPTEEMNRASTIGDQRSLSE